MADQTEGTAARTTGDNPTAGRWLLVGAALLLQFSIGAVYAWSVFAKALKEAGPFQISSLEASVPFEVMIGMIFIGTYIGGRIQDRRGPRVVALTGGVIYAIGVVLASFAGNADELWLEPAAGIPRAGARRGRVGSGLSTPRAGPGSSARSSPAG